MAVKDGITEHFGRSLGWWAVHVVILGVLLLADMVGWTVGKWWWPSRIEVWQELEKREDVRKMLVEVGGEGGYGVGVWGRGREDDEEVEEGGEEGVRVG